jgi:hypothetical protein
LFYRSLAFQLPLKSCGFSKSILCSKFGYCC